MKRHVHYQFGTFVFFRQPNGFYCLGDNDGTAVFLTRTDLRELAQALREELERGEDYTPFNRLPIRPSGS